MSGRDERKLSRAEQEKGQEIAALGRAITTTSTRPTPQLIPQLMATIRKQAAISTRLATRLRALSVDR